MNLHKLLVGTLALVLIAGFGTPAFAVAPNFVISDPGGGDCTSAKINGVWDGPSKTCTVSDGFIIQILESLTVNAGVTLVLDGGSDPGQLVVNISGNMVNNGSVIILGGSGNTDGAIILVGTSIVNNGSFEITGGSGVGSGVIGVILGTLLNNCGGTMDFIGGTGPLSGRLTNSDTVISSPVSAITHTPGVGEGSGVFFGNAIIPGLECPAGCQIDAQCNDMDACTTDVCNLLTGICSNTAIVCDDAQFCTLDSCNPASGCVFAPNPDPLCQRVGGEFIGVDSTALLLAGFQANALWLIPAIVAAVGIGIVIARKF